MTDAITTARATIEARLGELREETRRLEGALAALDGGSSSRSRKRPAASTGTTGRRPRSASKRAPRGFRRDQFIETVRSAPGARPSEIAKSMGIRPQQVHALARKLRDEKLIVKQGAGYAPADASKAE